MDEKQNQNNNDQSALKDAAKEVAKTGVNIAKNEVKKQVSSAIMEAIGPAIPYILAGIGIFFLALIFVGIINAVPIIIDTILNPNDPNSSLDGSIQSIVSIDESGAFQLNEEDLSKQMLEKLESQKINNQVIGFDTEAFGDMLDKYIKAEVQTTFPKTEHPENDLDGIIIINRASTDSGEITPLKYTDYESFKAMVSQDISKGTDNSLEYFSINPNDFKLCVARHGGVVGHEDCYGNPLQVQGSGTSESAIEIDEINYQKYVQNYSVPLNFFVALHLISQDEAFMEEVVEMVLGEGKENPIELTYVETTSVTETICNYTGFTENTRVMEEIFDPNGFYAIDAGEYNEEDLEKFRTYEVELKCEDGTVQPYIKEGVDAHKTVATSSRGQLYISNADTWLHTTGKDISDMKSRQSSRENTEVVVDSTTNNQIIRVKDSVTGELKNYRIWKHTKIEEKTTSSTTSKRFATTDKDSEIKVDDFIELIEKYPKVKDNLISAPSLLFSLLERYENTQSLSKIMRYVMFKLNDINYGYTDDNLEDLFSIFGENESINGWGLREYLHQFGGAANTHTFDGKEYYIMYSDSDGNPTIGYGDLKWSSNHEKFSAANIGIGYVRIGKENGHVEEGDVQLIVNDLLGRL